MIRYSVSVKDANAHLFEVVLTASVAPNKPVRCALPAWIPGSYMIREFVRHLRAPVFTSGGTAITGHKIDKHTWSVTPTAADLQITYTVYAWDLSVRAAHLDSTHGFFNGTSLFLQLDDRVDEPCELTIVAPKGVTGSWKVATTLPAIDVNRAGFGQYQAANYDELIDHPVEMGSFKHSGFTVLGTQHRVVFTGPCDVDFDRLTNDLTKICAEQIQLFEPITIQAPASQAPSTQAPSTQAPFSEYLFMTQVTGDGYGGLEHRSSTALICVREDLPFKGMKGTPKGYVQFLGLCSHEYFHSWNVKRIKPARFTPYDLTQENYTQLLWLFEGFTSYYDDLILLRSGVIDLPTYLDLLAATITKVMQESGRLVQSVAQSSFDSWIKYYRQDENSPNSIVSYYTKGSLVALCLDLTIRSRTNGTRSLDDVMRALWQLRRGLGEDEFGAVVSQATGFDLSTEINTWTQTTSDLPLRALLEAAGYAWTETREAHPDIGMRLAQRNQDLVITVCHEGRPAQRAGLSAQDVIVAMDGIRTNDSQLKARIARKAPGDSVQIHAFRRDELKTFTLRLAAPVLASVRLSRTSGE